MLTVELEDGSRLKIRRLGPGDPFALHDIVREAIQAAEDRNAFLSGLLEGGPLTALTAVLFQGVQASRKSALEWLESLPAEDRELHLADWCRVIKAVVNGPDVTAFLELGWTIFSTLQKAIPTDEKGESEKPRLSQLL